MTQRKTMGAMAQRSSMLKQKWNRRSHQLAADKYNILGLLDVWFQNGNNNADKYNILGLLDVKCWILGNRRQKICVQTSFSRIQLRICLQIKVKLENLYTRKTTAKKGNSSKWRNKRQSNPRKVQNTIFLVFFELLEFQNENIQSKADEEYSWSFGCQRQSLLRFENCIQQIHPTPKNC